MPTNHVCDHAHLPCLMTFIHLWRADMVNIQDPRTCWSAGVSVAGRLVTSSFILHRVDQSQDALLCRQSKILILSGRFPNLVSGCSWAMARVTRLRVLFT